MQANGVGIYEVDDRAVADAIGDVAKRTTHDRAERHGFDRIPSPPEPER